MTLRQMLKPLRRAVLMTLALLFLLEAWLWKFGGRWLAALLARLPLDATRERIRRSIEPLSPWATLPVFLVPLLLIAPFNILAAWLLMKGRVLGALVTILMQKLLGVAVLSFMFNACQSKLLQIAAVRWVYELLMRWYRAAHTLTQPYRKRIRRWVAPARRGLWQVARRQYKRYGRGRS